MEPLYLIVSIRPHPERIEEARSALLELRAASRREDGCELFDLVLRPDLPTEWFMLEKWTTRGDWQSHMLSAHSVAFGEIADQILAEPATIDFYSPV